MVSVIGPGPVDFPAARPRALTMLGNDPCESAIIVQYLSLDYLGAVHHVPLCEVGRVSMRPAL